jgi:hypothetical protein
MIFSCATTGPAFHCRRHWAALECRQKLIQLAVQEVEMKTRMIFLTLPVVLIAASACFAQDAHMGTWKLNTAQSKIANGAPRNTKVVYEAAGDQIKVTVDGLNPDGTASHDEWTGKIRRRGLRGDW